MKKATKRLVGLAAVVVCAVFIACSGDSSGTSGSGSGTSGGTSGTSGGGTSGSSGSGTSGTSGIGTSGTSGTSGVPSSQYCGTTVSYYQRCGKGVTPACITTKQQQCTKEEGIYSTAYLQAAATCQSGSASCDTAAKHDCESRFFGSTAPTAVDIKFRNDACQTCPSTKCSSTFFSFGIGTTPDGPGYFAYVMNDTYVQQMDQQCTGSALQIGNLRCEDALQNCVQAIFSKAVAPVQSNCN
jgi:hypothetical protein